MSTVTYLYDAEERARIQAEEPDFDDADAPPYFWNYEFRFDLRDAPLALRYEVRKRFDDGHLLRDGFSLAHVWQLEIVLGRVSVARQHPAIEAAMREGAGMSEAVTS